MVTQPRTAPSLRFSLTRLFESVMNSALMRNLGPFIPLILIWWLAVRLELVPVNFISGPERVATSFGDLIYKGILPGYTVDS